MPSRGRPKGSKNKEGHNAGGRREGAGRKRKHPLPEGSTPPNKRQPSQHDGVAQDAFQADGAWPPATEQHDIGTSAGLAEALPFASSSGGTDSGFGHLVQNDEQQPDAAVSSLLAAYLTNPLHPIPPHATQPPETLAQLAAFGSPELVKRAVGSALNHNFRMGGTPEWANQQPTMVEGPYLCLPSPSNDGSAQAKDLPPATLHGPMDPKLLAPSTVVAVYYACFAMPARSSPQEGYSLDPSLAAPRHYEGQSAQSQSIPVDQGATAQTRPILGTPASGGGPDPYRRPEVDMSARQRAPRKCGVCGQYYCKGRGNRALCPKYDPGRPATPAKGPVGVRHLATEGDVQVPTDSHRSTGDNPFQKPSHDERAPSYADLLYAWHTTPHRQDRAGDAGLEQVGSQDRSSVSVPSSTPRKRGPRHCGVCKQLGCIGNGNRRLCPQFDDSADANSDGAHPIAARRDAADDDEGGAEP